MTSLRTCFLRNHRLAMLLAALALAMKALVPAGYMLDSGARVLTVHICADTLGQTGTKQIIVPSSGQGGDPGKAHSDSPCPFTALGHALLGGADPVQLALALLFLFALGFAPMAPVHARRLVWLRPPLRGPPALS